MKLRCLLASTAIAIIVQSPASAQEATPDNSGIQDIVVTAQRREENVQKTALFIEVFSGNELRAAGVGKADDLT
jgi:iron complex outermembrane recepter protein